MATRKNSGETSTRVPGNPEIPVHIQITEQLRKVSNAFRRSGQSKVQWLPDSHGIKVRCRLGCGRALRPCGSHIMRHAVAAQIAKTMKAVMARL